MHIEHPYFDEEGPVTHEYVLPVDRDEIPGEYDISRLPVVTRFEGQSLREFWQARVEGVSGGFARHLVGMLEEHVPYSVVLCSGFAWVAFKMPHLFDEATAHGNSVLIPFDAPIPDIVGGFVRRNHLEIFEFLDYFRRIGSGIPPTNLVLEAEVVTNGPQWDVPGVSAWMGSLVIYVCASGQHLLYSTERRYGLLFYEGIREIPESEVYTLLDKEIFGIGEWCG